MLHYTLKVAHPKKMKRSVDEIRCKIGPESCIVDHLRALIVHCDGNFLPMDLLQDYIQCSEHAHYFSTSNPYFYTMLGNIRVILNLPKSVRVYQQKLVNVNWRNLSIYKLIWNLESIKIDSNLIEIIHKKQDVHTWIASASLVDLCKNRYLINMLLQRNPEYFGLVRALQKRLSEVDTHGLFDLSSSQSFSFLKKCFSQSTSNVRVSKEDVPIYDVLSCVDNDIVKVSETVLCERVKEYLMRIDFPQVSRYVKKETSVEHIHMDCKVLVFYSELNKMLPSLVSINSKMLVPQIITYQVVVIDDMSVKEAIGGETLFIPYVNSLKMEMRVASLVL
jgi:predicted ribosome-associated RNA-binding protein Tma20